MSPSGIVEVVLLHMESKKHHSHCGAFFVCFLIDIRRIKLSNIRPLAKVFFDVIDLCKRSIKRAWQEITQLNF